MAELLETLHTLKGNSEKIDKYRALKGSKNLSFDKFTEEVRLKISEIPKIDKNELTESLQNVLVSLFENQPDKSVKILDAIKSSEEYIENLDKRQQILIEGLEDITSNIQRSINSIEIPETDLSSIESSIKKIKPVDVSEIERQLQVLSDVVIGLKDIKPQKLDIDLQPVIDAINAPRTDAISLVYDSHGFPIKAIIERNGPSIT